MMWSCASVVEGRKDASGFTLRALRVRRYEDWCRRQAWQTYAEESAEEVMEGRIARGKMAVAMTGY